MKLLKRKEEDLEKIYRNKEFVDSSYKVKLLFSLKSIYYYYLLKIEKIYNLLIYFYKTNDKIRKQK